MGRRGAAPALVLGALSAVAYADRLVVSIRLSTCTSPSGRRCYFSAQEGQLQPYRRLCLVP